MSVIAVRWSSQSFPSPFDIYIRTVSSSAHPREKLSVVFLGQHIRTPDTLSITTKLTFAYPLSGDL